MLVSILSDLHAGQYLDYDAGQWSVSRLTIMLVSISTDHHAGQYLG